MLRLKVINKPILYILVVFLIIIPITKATVDIATNMNNLAISGFSEKIKPEERHLIYINESEFYKNRTRSFSACYGFECFTPRLRKGQDSINYFKSLNLTDNHIYTMIQFETLDGDPTIEQMDLLAKDNITLFEYHGDHTYYAKIPRSILESKSYDFVRWAAPLALV